LDESLIEQLVGPASPKQSALLVSGSPQGVDPALVSRLARRVGFIVAVDFGADVMRASGVLPHLLLGDFDSISQDTLSTYRAAEVEVMAYDAHKDATDTELAFAELRRRGLSTVIVTNALKGRLDHELASLGVCADAASRGIRVVVIEDDESCVFLSADNLRDHETSRLDLVLNDVPTFISLVPWACVATVSISGVEWELDHALLKPSSSLGISNVAVTERIGIEVHEGTVIVVF
jgi:thiamine pyrophosphokinase